MPLLPPEPVVFPPNLFAEPPAHARRWWVFQTRARAEKAFARLLAKSQTAYFLPLYTQTWAKGGRRFRSHPPLFPGYVFVGGGPPARAAAFATKLVVREVPVGDQEQLDRELASVHHLLGGGDSLRPEDRLGKGSRVTITTGTYAGVEGRVLEAEADGSLRVCVEISLLGCGVSVPVERWMLKPLDPVATKRPGGVGEAMVTG